MHWLTQPYIDLYYVAARLYGRPAGCTPGNYGTGWAAGFIFSAGNWTAWKKSGRK
jgi:hypothetical protein